MMILHKQASKPQAIQVLAPPPPTQITGGPNLNPHKSIPTREGRMQAYTQTDREMERDKHTADISTEQQLAHQLNAVRCHERNTGITTSRHIPLLRNIPPASLYTDDRVRPTRLGVY